MLPTGIPTSARTALALLLAQPAWAQCGSEEIFPPAPSFQAHFASSLALDDDRLAIGAVGVNAFTGAVYIYDPRTLRPRLEIANPGLTAYSGFPADPQLAGNEVYVGSPGEGVAYAFDALSGDLKMEFRPAVPTANSHFGAALSLDGSYLVVGAPGLDYQPQDYPGLVHVFDRATGVELATLVPPDITGIFYPQGRFGACVALVDGLLVAGAPWDLPAGSVHVYDVATGTRLLRLTPPVGTAGFGESVAFDGERIVVGQGSLEGSLHVYDLSGALVYSVAKPAGHPHGIFGWEVALDGDLLAVVLRVFSCCQYEGTLYALDANTGAILDEVRPRDPDEYPSSIALHRGTLAIGESKDSTLGVYTGMAHVTELEHGVGIAYCSPATPNSTGLPATIEANGCELFDSTVILSATGLPAGRHASLLVAPDEGFVPFHQGSQGHLCLSGGVRALQLQQTGTGSLEQSLDLSQLGVSSGGTLYFQLWYRDTNPGPTSNFSDALAMPVR